MDRSTGFTRSRLIEILLPAAAAQGAEFPFPDQPDLRGVILEGLEVYDTSTILKGPSGAATITPTDGVRAVVVIAEASDEKIKYVPFEAFNSITNAGIVRRFRNLRPTWDQCKIRVTQTFAAVAVSSVCVMVFYRYANE